MIGKVLLKMLRPKALKNKTSCLRPFMAKSLITLLFFKTLNSFNNYAKLAGLKIS
jgi:hypothetical protein